MTTKVKIKKINDDAKIPSYAHGSDAGMDIYSVENLTVKAGEHAKMCTGIAMEIPDGFVGLVWDKSGISMNYGLKTLGGVIDSGYRGEVVIGVVNLSKEDYVVEKGNKIAQILIQKVESPEIKEVEELNDSERGEKGFGSTGVK